MDDVFSIQESNNITRVGDDYFDQGEFFIEFEDGYKVIGMTYTLKEFTTIRDELTRLIDKQEAEK